MTTDQVDDGEPARINQEQIRTLKAEVDALQVHRLGAFKGETMEKIISTKRYLGKIFSVLAGIMAILFFIGTTMGEARTTWTQDESVQKKASSSQDYVRLAGGSFRSMPGFGRGLGNPGPVIKMPDIGDDFNLPPDIGSGSDIKLRDSGPSGGGSGSNSGRSSVPYSVDDDDYRDWKLIARFVGPEAIYIAFQPFNRIRLYDMQRRIKNLYIELAMDLIVIAESELLKLKMAEPKRVGMFDWLTKADKKRHQAEIRRSERELNSIKSNYRIEANNRADQCCYSSNWRRSGNIKLTPGPRFQRLKDISINGW